MWRYIYFLLNVCILNAFVLGFKEKLFWSELLFWIETNKYWVSVTEFHTYVELELRPVLLKDRERIKKKN